MHRLCALLIVVFLTGCVSPQVAKPQVAKPICGTYKEIANALQIAAQEVKQSAGISRKGNLIEIWVGPTKDWTMVLIATSGKTCIVEVGNSWYSYLTIKGQKS